MKYKYNIKNLDCANCAKTIENKLNEDKNIKKAIVNFNSSTVTVLLWYPISSISSLNLASWRVSNKNPLAPNIMAKSIAAPTTEETEFPIIK